MKKLKGKSRKSYQPVWQVTVLIFLPKDRICQQLESPDFSPWWRVCGRILLRCHSCTVEVLKKKHEGKSQPAVLSLPLSSPQLHHPLPPQPFVTLLVPLFCPLGWLILNVDALARPANTHTHWTNKGVLELFSRMTGNSVGGCGWAQQLFSSRLFCPWAKGLDGRRERRASYTQRWLYLKGQWQVEQRTVWHGEGHSHGLHFNLAL